jgi:hypothetical protein
MHIPSNFNLGEHLEDVSDNVSHTQRVRLSTNGLPSLFVDCDLTVLPTIAVAIIDELFGPILVVDHAPVEFGPIVSIHHGWSSKCSDSEGSRANEHLSDALFDEHVIGKMNNDVITLGPALAIVVLVGSVPEALFGRGRVGRARAGGVLEALDDGLVGARLCAKICLLEGLLPLAHPVLDASQDELYLRIARHNSRGRA